MEAPLLQEPPNPVDAVKSQIEKAKEEAERKRQERLAALEEMNKGKQARVVVLKVKDVDDTNETLQRNIKARIARPDAKFYPEIDLFQAGRKEPDPTIRAIEQRGVVPEETFPIILAQVTDVEAMDWKALREEEWGLKAQELRSLIQELWFVDRKEVREPLFRLYSAIGYAAQNMNNTSPPFFQQIGDQPVNYYFYLAAAMAFQEPDLLDVLANQETRDSIAYYKQLLDEGSFGEMTVSFEMSGEWDPKKFASDFQVFVNGTETIISDPKGLLQLPPGRVDIYLKREDGHSLSDRVDLEKLEGRIYFVRDVARKRMGVDFANQLMEHPNECVPTLDGDILTYLNIYARLHEQAEIYIAVPAAGNPNKVYLWRFDRASGTLSKVLDDTGGFPVRLAMLAGTGVIFSNASLSKPTVTPITPGEDPVAPAAPKPNFTVNAIPFHYELRAHYVRMFVVLGAEFNLKVGPADKGQDKWVDEFQVKSNKLNNHAGNTTAAGEVTPVYHDEKFQRLLYAGFGVMLGKYAATGFGPRGYIRTGLYNLPHAIDLTAHLGLTKDLVKKSGRVRPLVDGDMFGGIMLPYEDSMLVDKSRKEYKVLITFGIKAGAGLTF